MTYYDKFLEKLKTIQYLKRLQKLRNQHGAVFALTALLLPVLFGFMGLGYDVGNLYLHKARLQDTADATALAGARGYVNELKKGSSTGVISLPSSDTQTKKDTAIAALKTNADNYIAKNNPVFQDKLRDDNRTEKFYSIGKEVTSSDRNNSTEYFRVVLSEPVQLYFLPVIGIKSSADVSVYATTKLSDNEIVKVSNPSSQPTDAEYKPVVITQDKFFDLKTGEHNTSANGVNQNYYNGSNVYVSVGGKIETSTLYSMEDSDGNAVEDELSTSVIEKDYDFQAFGISIRERFLKKYIDANYTEGSVEKTTKINMLNEFIADLRAWAARKYAWDKEYGKEYNEEYSRRYAQYEESLGLDKAKVIYKNWQDNNWDTEKYGDKPGWLPEPDNTNNDWTNWQWQNYQNYGITQQIIWQQQVCQNRGSNRGRHLLTTG